VVKSESWVELALQRQAQQAAKSYRVRVTEVAVHGNEVQARLVDSQPAWADFSLNEINGWMRRIRQPDYYGIDRETGRLAFFRNDSSASFMVGGVAVQARLLKVSAPQVIRNGKWTLLDQGWLERFRLVLVGWEEVARVTREVRVEKFAVGEEFAPGG
jgi:hypothetical protein